MQLFLLKNHSRNDLKCYCILFVVCLLAYWPLSFGVFSVKNDAINYFLPFRFNISSAIQNGEFPYWSPFIYLGYPLHGDMQSGVWNPIVLLLSLFSKYDLTLFHIEYLLYIFLSGSGMYLLSGSVTRIKSIRLFAALAYMLNGYIFGSGQFVNWVASAAFVPFVLHFYFRFLTTGKRSAALKTAISCWLLLVCGYPADLLYVFYIMLGMLITACWIGKDRLRTHPSYMKPYVINFLILVLVFLGLSAPALISYTELMPYYSRGTSIGYGRAIENSLELKNIISLLNPWPTWTNDFKSGTDPTGRNVFTGIATLCLFLFSLLTGLNRTGRFLLALFIFSFFFSLGDGFLLRKLSFYLLPGMDRFRHPSHFRLFFIIPMILLAASGLQKLSEERKYDHYFRFVCLALLSVCLLFTVLSLNSELIGSISKLHLVNFQNTALKQLLSSLTSQLVCVVGLVLQCFFLVAFLIVHRKKQFLPYWMAGLNLLNLFIFQALFPVNFVSKTHPSTVNTLIHHASTESGKENASQSLLENSREAFRYMPEIGLYYFYNKKVGISRVTNSPSFLLEQYTFLENNFLYNYIAGKPFIFFTDSTVLIKDSLLVPKSSCRYTFVIEKNSLLFSNSCKNGLEKITTINLRYNSLEVQVELDHPAILNLTQNFHQNWKVGVDGKFARVFPANGAFMAIPLAAGKHLIRWNYTPVRVYAGEILFILTIVCLVPLFIWRRTNNTILK